MDERKWAEFRARERRRANSIGALILCPFVIIVAVLKITEPMYYPVGDIRNSIAFRIVFYGLFIAIAVVGMVASVRWLQEDRRRFKEKPTVDSEPRARD